VSDQVVKPAGEPGQKELVPSFPARLINQEILEVVGTPESGIKKGEKSDENNDQQRKIAQCPAVVKQISVHEGQR
jgi:hypothetical protein